MQVLVVRNPHTRYEGIYVIGYEAQVLKYIELVENIIIRIEKLASEYRKNRNNKRIHFSMAKADFKCKCVAKYLKSLEGILKDFVQDDTYKEAAKLRAEYFKQSNLKNKKPFNGKQYTYIG